MSEQKNELILIPKYEKYMEYMLQVILKLPRTEKFNIGNEFKNIMYKMLENILYLNKIEISKRLYYLNLIHTLLEHKLLLISYHSLHLIFLHQMNSNFFHNICPFDCKILNFMILYQ